jgi:hypothetical protein
MQTLLEDLIQGVGWLMLKVVTGGRYRSAPDSRLFEGTLGFALVLVIAAGIYTWWPR